MIWTAERVERAEERSIQRPADLIHRQSTWIGQRPERIGRLQGLKLRMVRAQVAGDGDERGEAYRFGLRWHLAVAFFRNFDKIRLSLKRGAGDGSLRNFTLETASL
jgi:hypothetical protein